MAYDVKIIPSSATLEFFNSGTGTTISGGEGGISLSNTSTVNSTRFIIYGNNGQLFAVTDNLSGSLFSVGDISGLPILEVFDDNRVVMGEFNKNTLVVSGQQVFIGTTSSNTAIKLFVSGGTSYISSLSAETLTAISSILMNNGISLKGKRAAEGNEMNLIRTIGQSIEIGERSSTPDEIVIFAPVDTGQGVAVSGNNGIITFFENDGSVMIGPSRTPLARLHVMGSISSTNLSAISNIVFTRNGYPQINLYQSNIRSFGDSALILSGNAFEFRQKDDRASLVIYNSGKVGLGTTSANPEAHLHVTGSISAMSLTAKGSILANTISAGAINSNNTITIVGNNKIFQVKESTSSNTYGRLYPTKLTFTRESDGAETGTIHYLPEKNRISIEAAGGDVGNAVKVQFVGNGLTSLTIDYEGDVATPYSLSSNTLSAGNSKFTNIIALASISANTISAGRFSSHPLPTRPNELTNKQYVDSLSAAAISGSNSGAAGYLAKFASGTSTNTSIIYQSGATGIGIGTADPQGNLDVQTGGMWTYFGGNLDGAVNPISSRNYGIMFGWNYSGGGGESRMLYGSGLGSNQYLSIGRWSGTAISDDFIFKNGQLGIGTNPQLSLHIQGSNQNHLRLQNSNGAWNIGPNTQGHLQISTTALDVIYATTAGYIGIGITAPLTKLHVAGSVSAAGITSTDQDIVIISKNVGAGFISWQPTSNTDERMWGWRANQVAYGDFTINQSIAQNENPFSAGSRVLYFDNIRNATFTGNLSAYGSNHYFGGNISISGLLIKNSNFGYSSLYRILQLGENGTEKALSLGVDLSTNPDSNFTGNEIIIPHNKSIIAPKASNTGYWFVLKSDDTYLYLGGTDWTGSNAVTISRTNGNVKILGSLSAESITARNTLSAGLILAGNLQTATASLQNQIDSLEGGTANLLSRINSVDSGTASNLSLINILNGVQSHYAVLSATNVFTNTNSISSQGITSWTLSAKTILAGNFQTSTASLLSRISSVDSGTASNLSKINGLIGATAGLAAATASNRSLITTLQGVQSHYAVLSGANVFTNANSISASSITARLAISGNSISSGDIRVQKSGFVLNSAIGSISSQTVSAGTIHAINNTYVLYNGDTSGTGLTDNVFNVTSTKQWHNDGTRRAKIHISYRHRTGNRKLRISAKIYWEADTAAGANVDAVVNSLTATLSQPNGFTLEPYTEYVNITSLTNGTLYDIYIYAYFAGSAGLDTMYFQNPLIEIESGP
ncbi:MAG: beta strand repeat-containing protein [Paludibacter sp.]